MQQLPLFGYLGDNKQNDGLGVENNHAVSENYTGFLNRIRERTLKKLIQSANQLRKIVHRRNKTETQLKNRLRLDVQALQTPEYGQTLNRL